MDLPRFKYHPDPVATGAVAKSDGECARCRKVRGYVYAGSPYALADDLNVCPWCIADGSAAKEFNATFVQDIEEQLPAEIMTEVFERTPGYVSWQGENWLCHCNDACEFHGDFTRAGLQALKPEDEARFLEDNDWIEDWPRIKKNYQPASDLALYKFVCRHCGVVRIGVDLS